MVQHLATVFMLTIVGFQKMEDVCKHILHITGETIGENHNCSKLL